MAYKILWYSIPALHDNSNGAAIHNKILLEGLAARGMQIKVLNALVADDPHGLEIFNRINAKIQSDPKTPFLQFTDRGVEYIVAKTKGHLAQDVTTADQGRIFDLFVQCLEKFQPDVVMGYSGDIFSAYLRREAQARGIPVVYALCNGLHRTFGFADCDLVFAPSEATAKLYRDGDGIDVKAVGQFINREQVTVDPQKRDPKYITLVNPAPEKGLAIFVKLAQEFCKKHPEQRFLVVKSVGNYQQCLLKLHYADGTPFIKQGEPNPIPMIDVAEHTDDIRLVYAITKAILTPSVWHESWGCVATEAVFNNIPVLSSKSGGLPEAVREGGILLDAPQSTQKDFNCVPSDEEIKPWVEALEQMLAKDWTEECTKASSYNDLNASIDRLMEHLEPLLQKGQQNKHPLDSSYFFSQKSMNARREAYAKAMPHLLNGNQPAPAEAQAQAQAPATEAAASEAEAKAEAKPAAKKAPAKKSTSAAKRNTKAKK